jgi:hypothetical protein
VDNQAQKVGREMQKLAIHDDIIENVMVEMENYVKHSKSWKKLFLLGFINGALIFGVLYGLCIWGISIFIKDPDIRIFSAIAIGSILVSGLIWATREQLSATIDYTFSMQAAIYNKLLMIHAKVDYIEGRIKRSIIKKKLKK